MSKSNKRLTDKLRQVDQRVVSSVLVSIDGKILMGKSTHLPGAIYKDSWHIPGGVRDEGETVKDTLVRETLEESGVEIPDNAVIEPVVEGDKGKAVRTLSTGEKVLCKLSFYTYKVLLPKKAVSYKVSDTEEMRELTWFIPEKLKDLKHSPPSIKLFKKMGYL